MMDGKMVATRSATMTFAKDEQNHIDSPNWCLARASSPASTAQFAGLEPQEDQEVDITRNLVSIKKMQDNQMKCTKFLTQLRGKVPDSALDEKDHKPGTEELNEIWSAVNTLRNSIVNNSTWSEKRNSSRMKDRGTRQQRKTNLVDSNLSDSALHQHRRSSSEHSS
ncbi:coiled-coil domain-containing protein 159 isoform X2 [Erythrolamprus reginae]|uniref:coiled-coil domain-containing protein 159 isoform X2 n=1 Tax=Erythrolamprus reginae TaxID=121349 RepID=UPI00396C95BF